MEQWTYFYPDGAIGQIVSPNSTTFPVAVWPPRGPMSGAGRVAADVTLTEAVGSANRIATQSSNLSDWSKGSFTGSPDTR